MHFQVKNPIPFGGHLVQPGTVIDWSKPDGLRLIPDRDAIALNEATRQWMISWLGAGNLHKLLASELPPIAEAAPPAELPEPELSDEEIVWLRAMLEGG